MLRGLALNGLSVAVAGVVPVPPRRGPGASTTALPELPKTPDGALQWLMAGNDRLLANLATAKVTLYQ